MKRPKPAPADATARVDAFVEGLFTNGFGERADRLVLLDDAKRDRGGWCRGAVRDRAIDLVRCLREDGETPSLKIGRMISAALRYVDAWNAAKKAREEWQAAAQAAHAAHGSPGHDDQEPIEVGGGSVQRAPTERCWMIMTHGDFNETCPLPVVDWCDCCRTMAEKRRASGRAGQERGKALRALKAAAAAIRKGTP